MLKFKIFWIIVLFFCAVSMSAQQGRVRVTGKITDSSNGETLPGASILIKGSTIGTITEMDGEYSILVPDEQTVLIYSFLGFVEQEVTVGNTRVIDISLQQNTEELEEVVVTAQAIGQIGARQAQIKSSTIKNVVAPDRLQENPDANAVEAIGRLPGVSVLRSGGEGSQIVIRGLEPRYTNITLEGVSLASASNSNRSANLSGISQYILQGVEVYKALTPELEANSVGGTVNLKLQETPKGFHYNLMVQGGYNNQNNSYGNYKLMGEISNRFLDDKLGIFFSANAEKVNRSTQTMSAGYGLQSTDVDILLNGSNLNIQNRVNYRRSATLSMDYRVHPTTSLKLYGLYSYTNIATSRQSKSYGHTGAGSVGYSMADNPLNESQMIHTALSGATKTDFLNMEVDYGVVFSQNIGNDPDSRSWNYGWALVSTDENTTIDQRRRTPGELIPLYTDGQDSLHNSQFGTLARSDTERKDQNLTAYMDIKVPFHIGDNVHGYVKFGGKYRKKERYVDITSGSNGQHPFIAEKWYDAMPWLEMSERGGNTYNPYTLEGFEDYVVDDFLGGEYDYGWYFDTDKMNEVSDWWEDFTDSLVPLGKEVWLPIVGDITHLGYSQDLEACMINDQEISENYYAGYTMAEFNFGKWLMVMPGFRYERTDATLQGFQTSKPLYTPSTLFDLVGKDTSATREDAFFLPMVHMRIKPSEFLYFHLAYTQTISRPDFNAISPNIYIDPGAVFMRHEQNPDLRAERWTNYDAQATLHGSKIGLLSVSGFYKTVEDKIWHRSYKRIKGDPVVVPFGENDVVDMSIWENHSHDITLLGMEFEWQTSFWYLPRPFNYFTLYLNYTYTHSETSYPLTRLESVVPPEGGRPTSVRIDSVGTGPMLYQPKHIANASLGFNYKGFNTWLSFQYNGQIWTYKNYYVDELDRLKENFYRVDLQLTYDLPLKKLPGELQVLGNFANLTNFQEVSRLRGDPRFTFQEAYGWTADLGIRYRF
jgi:TonB-dependent receptor